MNETRPGGHHTMSQDTKEARRIIALGITWFVISFALGSLFLWSAVNLIWWWIDR